MPLFGTLKTCCSYYTQLLYTFWGKEYQISFIWDGHPLPPSNLLQKGHQGSSGSGAGGQGYLASQIHQVNINEQWVDRCHSDIIFPAL